MRRISNTADVRAGLGIGEPSSELFNKEVRVWGSKVRPRVVWLSSMEPNDIRPANALIRDTDNEMLTISDPQTIGQILCSRFYIYPRFCGIPNRKLSQEVTELAGSICATARVTHVAMKACRKNGSKVAMLAVGGR